MCFIQDEDADFMAKLAKLMSAAGTQLLNSYSKYDSIIFYFFCPIFPQAVSCPCKVKFTFLFSHLFANLFCLGIYFSSLFPWWMLYSISSFYGNCGAALGGEWKQKLAFIKRVDKGWIATVK